MKNIKLVACDMDGTLLNDNKEISPENILAVKKLKDAGIYFVIATGRHDSMIKGYLDTLGIEMPVISCNGALVREPFSDQVFLSVPMTRAQTLNIAELCKNSRADYHIYAHNTIYSEGCTNKMIYYQEMNRTLPPRDQIQLFISSDYKAFIENTPEELYKVLIIPDAVEDGEGLTREIAKNTGLSIFRSDINLLDVMQKGITKSHGLKALCESLGISREETAALGDQANDLDMIEYAGVGIAVQNATPEIKKAAGIITKSTNNEHAVAEAISMLLEA